MPKTIAPISKEERQRRQQRAEMAKHELRLEGLAVTAFGKEVERAWVDGELSEEEAIQKLIDHHTLK